MEDDRNRAGFGHNSQLFVACIVRGSAEFSGNVAMVFYRAPEVFPKQWSCAEQAFFLAFLNPFVNQVFFLFFDFLPHGAEFF